MRRRSDERAPPGSGQAGVDRLRRYARTIRSSLPSRTVVFALLVAATPASADCELPHQGEGRVVDIVDARTLRLDDGREVRLAGLAPLPPGHASRAAAALRLIAVGQSIALFGETDAPDRYGRQSLLARRDGAERSLQADMLAQGDALSDLTLAACASAFRAAEATARRRRAGVWADRAAIKNAESRGELLAGVGRFAVVEGRARSVRRSGSITYVNFGRRWTRDFAVTIPGRVLPLFEAAGMTSKVLESGRLRIRGFIDRRGGPDGSPTIEAIRPGQIEIVGADDLSGFSE